MWSDGGEVSEEEVFHQKGETGRSIGLVLQVQTKHKPGLLDDCVQVAGETGWRLGAPSLSSSPDPITYLFGIVTLFTEASLLPLVFQNLDTK